MKHSMLFAIVFSLFQAALTSAQGSKVDTEGSYGFNASSTPLGTPKIRGDLTRSNPTEIPAGTVAESYERRSPDCGANALYVLLRVHERTCSRQQIRSEVPITGKGASLLDLQQVAARYGMPCKIVQISPQDIGSYLPAILLISQDGTTEGHYVVGFSANGNSVGYIDGTSGKEVSMKVGEFERCFTGYALYAEESVSPYLYLGVVVVELFVLAAIVYTGVLRKRRGNSPRVQVSP